MLKYCSIGSGSSGNCHYVGYKDTNILVDAGLSGKRITTWNRYYYDDCQMIISVRIMN